MSAKNHPIGTDIHIPVTPITGIADNTQASNTLVPNDAIVRITDINGLFTALLIPFLIRFSSFAPQFCATQVENAFPKSCTGMYAKESIFTAAANAAIITVPKLFTNPCTIRIPKFMIDCCKLVITDKLRIRERFSFPQYISSFVILISFTFTYAQIQIPIPDTYCENTVAPAAP